MGRTWTKSTDLWQSPTWFTPYTHLPQILNLLGKIVHSHPFNICLNLSSSYTSFVLQVALFKLWSSPTPIVFDNCSSPSKKMMDKKTVLKNMCYHYNLKQHRFGSYQIPLFLEDRGCHRSLRASMPPSGHPKGNPARGFGACALHRRRRTPRNLWLGSTVAGVRQDDQWHSQLGIKWAHWYLSLSLSLSI